MAGFFFPLQLLWWVLPGIGLSRISFLFGVYRSVYCISVWRILGFVHYIVFLGACYSWGKTESGGICKEKRRR